MDVNAQPRKVMGRKEGFMALTENGMDTTMLVSPTGGYGGGNGLFGGGDSWLGILFLIALCNGGFGFGGFGGGYGAMMGMGMADGFGLYPWLNNSQNINDGFRDQMLNSTVQGIQNSITSGFGDVQLGIAGVNQNICQTGNGIINAVTGAQNALAQQLYGNEIANLERSYAAQTANSQGLNAIQSQLATCCCENRAATADVKYTLAQEGCATRTADAQNTNALLTAFNSGIQSIKDQLCSDKIESKNDIIAQLRSELMFARGQASQDVQTAAIQLGQRNLANEVEQYVAPRAIPAYMVQNPNCCTNACGCGCNGSF
jgi:hypothetical protein